MSADTVCRVCLVNNLNLHGVRNDLRNAFERITRQKYNKVGYPLSMCYICLSMLWKCHRFMETARDTNNVLKQWLKQQNEMEVAQPLYIYSLSKIELVSMTDEDVPLQLDIKMEEVDLEPDYIEYDTGMEIEKTDIDFSVDSPNDSTYSDSKEDNNDKETDFGEDNNDREIDSLLDSIMDIKETRSLASDVNVHASVETRLEVVSSHDNGAPTIKKSKTEETKREYQAPETSRETADYSETSNNITPLNTSPSQSDKTIHRETKIKPTFGIKRTKKQTSKSNKSRETNNSVRRRKGAPTIKKRKTKETKREHQAPETSRETADNSETSNNITPLNTSPSQSDKAIHRETKIKPTFDIKRNNKQTSKSNKSRETNNSVQRKRNEYICDFCNYKTTDGKSILIRHIRTHTGEKPLSCSICGYRCILTYDLKSHMRRHTGEKPFCCHICSKRFPHKSTLTMHIKLHTGEKPLTQRTKTHTTEKRFSCDICSYRCRLKDDLKRHMRKHTGEKPFSCLICGKSFAQETTLRNHIRTHTGEKPFSCNVCSYRCTHKCNLKMHMKTHTGEKPFPCIICKKSFAHTWNLKTHMRTHTG